MTQKNKCELGISFKQDIRAQVAIWRLKKRPAQGMVALLLVMAVVSTLLPVLLDLRFWLGQQLTRWASFLSFFVFEHLMYSVLPL